MNWLIAQWDHLVHHLCTDLRTSALRWDSFFLDNGISEGESFTSSSGQRIWMCLENRNVNKPRPCESKLCSIYDSIYCLCEIEIHCEGVGIAMRIVWGSPVRILYKTPCIQKFLCYWYRTNCCWRRSFYHWMSYHPRIDLAIRCWKLWYRQLNAQETLPYSPSAL